MSKEVIDHSADLQQLVAEGYELEIVGDAYLLIHGVPYVTPEKMVKRGTLVSNLYQSGGRTIKPTWHAAFFIGECPSNSEGVKLNFVVADNKQVISAHYTIDYTLSSKADYLDHYQKTVSYIKLLEHQAQQIEPGITAATRKVHEPEEEDSVFEYADTNSANAMINFISNKLKGQKIAVIGTGGTGGYIIDMLAKTPVAEIHLFDDDFFFQNNAFRAPGAPSKAKLLEKQKKTDYFKEIYSNMHKGIISHPYAIDESNLSELNEMTVVFMSMDSSPIKKLIIDHLIYIQIPLIHAGMAIQEIDGGLKGQVKVTTIDSKKHDHIASRISFANPDDDLYNRNIQIADLNALNAILAIIRWKRMFGFYKSIDLEYFSNYVIYMNEISNSEI